MHLSSYQKMEAFRKKYLACRETEKLQIYDLGSQDVNGSYQPIFSESNWNYIGLDMEEGKNVDIVLKSPYVWREISSSSADVFISGQAFEHIQFFWISMLEIVRVLKPGGICCIIAPSTGPEHRWPHDCWRFYPDGMASLAHFVQMEVLEVMTQWEDPGILDGSDFFHDSILICRKWDHGTIRNMKSSLKHWLQHRVITIGLR